MQKSGVVFGVHDAEADVFAVQAFEGGAVTDHETLTEKVGGGRVGFVSGDILQCFEQAGAF